MGMHNDSRELMEVAAGLEGSASGLRSAGEALAQAGAAALGAELLELERQVRRQRERGATPNSADAVGCSLGRLSLLRGGDGSPEPGERVPENASAPTPGVPVVPPAKPKRGGA